jgi:hypothetical protein
VFSQDVDSIRGDQRRAIEDLDPRKFFIDQIDRGRKEVSHFVAQYQVSIEGEKCFREAHLDFVSEQVRLAAQEQFGMLELNQKIRFLRKNDEIPTFMASACRSIYEEVIAANLVQGVSWEKSTRNMHFSRFNLKVKKSVEGRPPSFEKMEPRVLYRSLKENYPAVDMMYKTDDGMLVGIQVTRLQESTRTVKRDAVDSWLDSVGLGGRIDRSNVSIAVVPRPSIASEFTAYYDVPCVGYPDIEIWSIPSDYSSSAI